MLIKHVLKSSVMCDCTNASHTCTSQLVLSSPAPLITVQEQQKVLRGLMRRLGWKSMPRSEFYCPECAAHVAAGIEPLREPRNRAERRRYAACEYTKTLKGLMQLDFNTVTVLGYDVTLRNMWPWTFELLPQAKKCT